MRRRGFAGRAVAIGALAGMVWVAGCQTGGTGGGDTRAGGTSTESGPIARASAVSVTYYYLPG
jgi:hypothetical protein